ncbi:nucleotidyltransferase domain-containing protein [Maribacter stanieri]|uniref:nucleotidyltransferase domain-containing protein n=1 Tax=Maribacter stanieri TaxID=440514 RepID=UPI002495029D|nr:nucleotidyltransferase [Maribacter stanieri]
MIKTLTITERQLETWSHQGAIQTSATTYESIKNCIGKANWNDDVYYDIYLQGSYKNSTNIYGNSDVDIVVQFNSIYSYSTEKLNETEKSYFKRDFEKAKYTLQSFKKAVIKRLKLCYGDDSVVVNDKSILVKGNGSSRLDADVVVCNPYRKYTSYSVNGNKNYIEGIVFETETTNQRVINFPKVHYDNGVIKNSQIKTLGNFKKIVRIFKNLKATMVSHGQIGKKVAPSYFVECLVYNARNNHFKKYSYSPIIVDIINQFASDILSGEIHNYVVQNEQRKLFGSGDQQWSVDNATIFVTQLVKLWKKSGFNIQA